MGLLWNGSIIKIVLKKLLIEIPKIRRVWQNVSIIGSGEQLNQELEKAARVADFF